jgi:alpha/beta superfamily hydrolase
MPSSPPEAVVVEAVRFAAGPHHLEGALAYPETVPWGAVVLAGPHPLLGAALHDHVVRALGDGLAGFGLATLRFDYRDVGGPDESGYRDDLAAAAAFLRAAVGPDLPLALAGHGFGCALLPAALPAGDGPTALVLVAPALEAHDHGAYRSARGPKLIVCPEGGPAAAADRALAWARGLSGPARVVRVGLDGRSFRGHEAWLTGTVATFLATAWR